MCYSPNKSINLSNVVLTLRAGIEMRERSQQKGKNYQRSVKLWLAQRPFLGFTTESYGDAYDLTKGATRVGQKYFDFSLKLLDHKQVKRILYVECKYRDEDSGSVDTEFSQFFDSIHLAASIEKDVETVKTAEFCFVSNIPPKGWRNFLRDRQLFYEKQLLKLKHQTINKHVLAQTSGKTHVLVLSPAILGE